MLDQIIEMAANDTAKHELKNPFKAPKLTVFDIIGMVISALCFLFMSYQLIRSARHYHAHVPAVADEKKSIVGIHIILGIANISYLLYEFN